MGKNQEGLVHLALIIIVVVVLGFMGYLMLREAKIDTNTKTPDSPTNSNINTADWQTYRNEEFGFEFKYPAEWPSPEEETVSSNAAPLYKEIRFGNVFIAQAKDEGYSSPYTLAEGMQSLFKDNYDNLSTDKLTAIRINGNGQEKLLISENPDSTKVVALFYNQTGFGTNQPTLESFLSSFEFTKPIKTGGWKSYSNNNLGFSFKYPENFTVEEQSNQLTIRSPIHNCREKGAENNPATSNKYGGVSRVKIDIISHSGQDFKQIWSDAFGFTFTDNSYDGTKTIDNKKAYYFYQGAESSIGRQAYLIMLDNNNSLEVNLLTPVYDFECEDGVTNIQSDPQNTALANQILSTFEFIEQ